MMKSIMQKSEGPGKGFLPLVSSTNAYVVSNLNHSFFVFLSIHYFFTQYVFRRVLSFLENDFDYKAWVCGFLKLECG
ncbi:MAG: hypothetical protein JXR70_06160 [Spirochaetales bacterium]|nr:hypothetical protein [Spirochaetales bacterium]